MKKYIETAEVELVTLDANDIVTASEWTLDPGSENDPKGDGGLPWEAPSRYNYRGMATEWEANEEW